MENILNNLNDIQLNAVKDTNGAQLILAGAGSGKTRVVTTKIAYLIEEESVNPQEILAFTFTNKAAKEMKDRVAILLNTNVDRMWIGTFHSICVRILRRDLNLVGYTKNFTIFDTTDQKTLIKECLKELNIDSKIYTPNYIQGRISSLKNEGIKASEFEKFAYSPMDKTILELYRLYEEKLQNNNAFDFDDLIIKVIELLNSDSLVRKYYQHRFRYVFVDEYQDTNNIQYELIKILSNYHNNICAVGDADQSIYKWRGANINNILNFEKDFDNSKRVILSQNYRSTKNILNSANAVISNNNERIKKDLWTSNEDGNLPTLFEAQSGTEEAYYVVDEINKLINLGKSLNEIAILYRSNSLSRAFEEQLIKNNIKYKVIGGIKFYDRAEIKDILAYLRLIVNTNDDISLRRIINSPKRGIGDVTVDKLNEISLKENTSLYNSLNFLETYSNMFDQRAFKKLESFKNLIDNLILKSNNMNIFELVEFLLDRVEYINLLEKQNTIEAKSKIENIQEFLGSIKLYEEDDSEATLADFISGISLLSDVDKTEELSEAVSLLTVHSAKGLEFENVFLVALEEGIFPSSYAEGDEDLQEERRLMYVAITRAKENLNMSYAKTRIRFGKSERQMKSSFIEELGETINKLNVKSFLKKQFIPRETSKFTNSYKNSFNKSNYDRQNLPDNSYKSDKPFEVSKNVKHKKWGLGTITQIKNSDGDELVTVLFDSGELKTFIGSLAPMEVIDE